MQNTANEPNENGLLTEQPETESGRQARILADKLTFGFSIPLDRKFGYMDLEPVKKPVQTDLFGEAL